MIYYPFRREKETNEKFKCKTKNDNNRYYGGCLYGFQHSILCAQYARN